MFISFLFKNLFMIIQKKKNIKQKGTKGATKIYIFFLSLAQKHEQDLNAKPGPYPKCYKVGNLKVHFKINI
jgi:hypothetical protein